MRQFMIFVIACFVLSCQQQTTQISKSSEPTGDIRKIVILYTNDEHGWMEKNAYNSGAGGMVHLWKQKEGYEKDGHFLVLSGGDMWTGPAISTLTSGKSMVEIMNAMGYHAAAAGNHEFDFTIDTLHVRLNEMKFPLLAANIVEKSSGQLADFVKPYRIIEVNEIKVGIIGLASRITPRTTKPANVSDYDFTSYAKALRANAPQLKSKGAELLITIGHICEDEIWPLLPLADSLGISIMTGGHCHQVYHYDTLGDLDTEWKSFGQLCSNRNII